MKVDAHQHFWRLADREGQWPPASLAAIHRDFGPQDLAPQLQATGVDATVLVQSLPSVADTHWMLSVAADTPFVRGVVGWVDFHAADVVAQIDELARNPLLKGLRPMLQDLPDDDWINTAPRPQALQALLALGLRFDALVHPRHLPALLRFLRRWPELPVVIDHAAKPLLDQGWDADWAPLWREHMAEIARLPQVCCKFSGLLTEMTPQQRVSTASSVACLRPVWDALLQWFGPARLMWGSDWPVSTLAGSYAAWVSAAGSLIGEFSADDQALVWHGTAQRFYGIE